MPNAENILESCIANAMHRLDARSAARQCWAAPVRSVPSDEEVYALVQARKRAAAKRELADRRASNLDIRTRLLVSNADVMLRAHALHNDSTLTWRECMLVAWDEARGRKFAFWGWLGEHHGAAADLTRQLVSLELGAMQQPELAQTCWKRQADVNRDEINRARMSLGMLVSHIVSQRDRRA